MPTREGDDNGSADSRVLLLIDEFRSTDRLTPAGEIVQIQRRPESRPESPHQMDLNGINRLLLPLARDVFVVVAKKPDTALDFQ